MTDIALILDPAIFDEAANGRPERLAAWLRSDRPLDDDARERLALLIEGQSPSTRRRRGRPKMTGTERFIATARMETATNCYWQMAAWLKRRQGAAFRREPLASAVARRYHLDAEKLLNAISRARK